MGKKRNIALVLATIMIVTTFLVGNPLAGSSDSIEITEVKVVAEKADTTISTYPVTEKVKAGDHLFVNDYESVFETVGNLSGMTYIQTAASHKGEQGEPFLSFQIDRAATVYIALQQGYNPGEETSGHWLRTGKWELTDDVVTAKVKGVNEMVTYCIWKRNFPTGVVELGGNHAKGTVSEEGLMYGIFVGECKEKTNLTAQPKAALTAYGDIPAFPGAEGGGKYATGGRGGDVYKVTTLQDYLPGKEEVIKGSFRDALSKGNRIITFDVSGTIELKTALKITGANTTIAGQTAPGDGICLKNYPLMISADNVIVRFLRVRPGDGAQMEMDAVSSTGKTLGILDHVSTSWASDEVCSIYKMTDFTVQWCNISEPNFHTIHSKGCHGYSGITGGQNFTYHHNLVAHGPSRNPRISGTSLGEYANNVIYNWGYKAVYGEWDKVNYANNYFKPGNATNAYNGRYVNTIAEVNSSAYKLYLAGNFIDQTKVVNPSKIAAINTSNQDNWNAIYLRGDSTREANEGKTPFIMQDKANHNTNITLDAAKVAYSNVLQYAGASLPKRDSVDQRIVNEVKTGTGDVKYSVHPVDPVTGKETTSTLYNGTVIQHEAGELNFMNIFSAKHMEYVWPELKSEVAPLDSDHDGMPDAWELERGLNPHDATDANKDYTKDGYTNIEKYINDLTVAAFPHGVVVKSPTVTESITQGQQLKDGGIYKMRNKKSGLYLAVEADQAKNRANVIQETENEKENQLWRAVSLGNGVYQFYSMVGDGNTFLLDVENSNKRNNTNIQIFQQKNSLGQKFEPKQNSDGTYLIFTKSSYQKAVIDVYGSRLASGTNVLQYVNRFGDNQKWFFELQK